MWEFPNIQRNHEWKSSEPRVTVGGDSTQEQRGEKKGTVIFWFEWENLGLSQCLLLCVVQKEAYIHKKKKPITQNDHVIYNGHCVTGPFFLVQYCSSFSKFFVKLPSGACTYPFRLPRLNLFASPLPPLNRPPYTCSDNHSSVSRLHPPLCPLHPSITHPGLYL